MIDFRRHRLLFHRLRLHFPPPAVMKDLTESKLPALKATTKTLNSHTGMNVGDVFKQQIFPLEEVEHSREDPLDKRRRMTTEALVWCLAQVYTSTYFKQLLQIDTCS